MDISTNPLFNWKHAGGDSCPPCPPTILGQSEELQHRRVEERRLLQVHRVAALWQDQQTSRWYVPLHEHGRVDAPLVFVANDDQRGDFERVQLSFERKN